MRSEWNNDGARAVTGTEYDGDQTLSKVKKLAYLHVQIQEPQKSTMIISETGWISIAEHWHDDNSSQ